MMPNTISINTDGIFVFLETPLNQKERITIIEAPIIRLYDDNISIVFLIVVLRIKIALKYHFLQV